MSDIFSQIIQTISNVAIPFVILLIVGYGLSKSSRGFL